MTVWAIVGRPNVGKSTLFNRLLGARAAVVSPVRGTTRDRLYGRLVWRGTPLTLIDTGGMELAPADTLVAAVQRQVRRALADAGGLLFVCDAREGLLPADQLLADALRPANRPITLIVNKVDGPLRVPPEFHALGFDTFPVSALHGLGIGELLDHLAGGARPDAAATAAASLDAGERLRVALVGRQNVGKSSLLNALLREERAIVHERPGTTRETLEAPLRAQGRALTVLDTAGLRHRRKVREAIDHVSMARTIDALRRCQVAVLVLDAADGATRDDRRIARRILDEGRALLIALNKWDRVARVSPRDAAAAVRRALPHAAHAPVLAVSAATGFHVPQLLAAVLRLERLMQRGLDPDACLALVQALWREQPPPRVQGRLPSLQQALWHRGCPPVLELLVRPPGGLLPAYQRYLLHGLARDPRLAGVPVRLRVRGLARAR